MGFYLPMLQLSKVFPEIINDSGSDSTAQPERQIAECYRGVARLRRML
jgi:hypothetical protein